MVYLYLTIAFVVAYLIGNINFARIFSWHFARKDITKVGSKNPGTMNMLRTRGFGEAFLTLIFEGIKSGIPALAGYFLFENFFTGFGHIAYFLIAFGAIIGHCYPVFYKFKGGKGVACTFGMFVFHPNCWWVSLVVFVCCFILFLFVDYPFLVSLTFMFVMSVFATCWFTVNTYALATMLVAILVCWLDFFFVVYLHRGNIKRLINGNENKVHLLDKLCKKKKTKSATETQQTEAAEENVEESTQPASDTEVSEEVQPTQE